MKQDKFEVDAFLSEYWQKHPLLIRNPWEAWSNPLPPDELAGLACEEDVESRLITRMRDRLKVEEGPLSETRFSKLGKEPWTLLVQAVDHHAPAVAALLEAFRFIPNWRIDDVMVSYANDQGGVGPHFDQYDVFLIQGLGKRRWRVGQMCDSTTMLLPHEDLRLLATFEATAEWILEPGDILYVPPGIAHEGVAVGDDCMTYSVGFRSPSRPELIDHWSEQVIAGMGDDDRYRDPELAAPQNPGEISPEAIAKLHAMATGKLLDRGAFACWFGQYNSAPKYPDLDWRPEEPIEVVELRERLGGDVPLCRNPASRFSFIRHGDDAVWLFVDGECFDCTGETVAFAEQLCAQDRLRMGTDLINSEKAIALIARLFNQGCLAFEPQDD